MLLQLLFYHFFLAHLYFTSHYICSLPYSILFYFCHQIYPSPVSYEDSLLCPVTAADHGSSIPSNKQEIRSSKRAILNSESSTKIGEKNTKSNLKRKLQQTGSDKLTVRENVQVVRDRVFLTVLTRAVDDSGWVEGSGESSTSTSTSSAMTPHFIQIVL